MAVSAAIVAAGMGGAGAYASAKKTVTLSVDGQQRQVGTFAGTVGDLLEGEGIEAGSRDTVAPSPESEITDGARVAFRNARPLTVALNGGERDVWVTALSVDEALDQLDIRSGGALLSASRSKRIPLDGMELEVFTRRPVTFALAGKDREVMTSAATVRDALSDARLKMTRHDRLSVPATAVPEAGQKITLTRVAKKSTTERVSVPHKTDTRSTSALYDDVSRVKRAGDNGMKVKTFQITTVDGKRTSKRLVSSRWADKPNLRVVMVGTKDRPVQHASRSGGSGGSGGSPTDDGLNWAALAECESGGDPNAVNSAGPYYGLYQFSSSTWASVGGSGVASDASSSEQTMRAQMLYRQAGAGQWPVCGSNLYS